MLDLAGLQARAWFTPGHGEELSHRIAEAIGRARRRIRIASPVLTAGPVLGTLAEVAAEARVDLRGVVDRTQVDEVIHQWRTNGRSAWKIPILASVLEHADFRGKPSTPYGPDTPHDFMHAKVTVADDMVFAGSFNLSRSGEQNAENVLEIHDAELADALAGFIDSIRERYRTRCLAPDDERRLSTVAQTSTGSSVRPEAGPGPPGDLALGRAAARGTSPRARPVVGAHQHDGEVADLARSGSA